MKQFMHEETASQRKIILQENAVKIEQLVYQRPLTEDDLNVRRESLADDCISLNILEDELKELKEDYKAKMQPLKDANKKRLVEIKTKQTTTDGIVYHMANHEDSIMETYDDLGFFISSRRLRPEEKQGNLDFKKLKAI